MTSESPKNVERTIAQKTGGTRVGVTGKATPDVVNDWLSIEVKSRQRLPLWLKNAMAQAKRNAIEGTLAIVVLHEKRQRYDDDIVMMTLKDFNDWFGGADGNQST